MLDNTITLIQLSTHDIEQLMLNTLEKFFEKKQIATPCDEADDFIDIDEAARIVGKAKTTIYGWTSSGSDFPHMKRGNKLYFSRKAILNWLADGRCKTQSEITASAATRSIR
jgi:predicted DNA-binding transcriptional regulator AlpA